MRYVCNFSIELSLCFTDSYTKMYSNNNGPGHAKTCLMPYANNKGANQPAHSRSLISTFVVRCLDSIICIRVISNVSRFQLASVSKQLGLNLRSKIPEDTFSRDAARVII